MYLNTNAYLEVTASFGILGFYVLMLFRWWHRRLIVLASVYNVEERRKRASRQSVIVMLLFYLPALGVLLGSIIHTSVGGFFIVSIVLLSLTPAVVWYARQIPGQRSLGYYTSRP